MSNPRICPLARTFDKNIKGKKIKMAKRLMLGYAPEGAKRRYEAHLVSKLTDCDGENSETESALDFARDCCYISPKQHETLTANCAEIGRMLGGMMKKSDSFLIS
jgi:23S rRNA-intervening sequence protein